jgi:hypothetical protein
VSPTEWIKRVFKKIFSLFSLQGVAEGKVRIAAGSAVLSFLCSCFVFSSISKRFFMSMIFRSPSQVKISVIELGV